jgi:hypothetical protein
MIATKAITTNEPTAARDPMNAASLSAFPTKSESMISRTGWEIDVQQSAVVHFLGPWGKNTQATYRQDLEMEMQMQMVMIMVMVILQRAKPVIWRMGR